MAAECSENGVGWPGMTPKRRKGGRIGFPQEEASRMIEDACSPQHTESIAGKEAVRPHASWPRMQPLPQLRVLLGFQFARGVVRWVFAAIDG